MSANQSDLSNSRYGYDFVVATTQESINGTMKEYLYNSTFPVVQMYWNQDDQGNPVAISRDELLKQTNGTDPLTVPSWNQGDPVTPAIQNIINSNFYYAFEAAIGIPSGIAPRDIPDIITLQPGNQEVIFNLICAQFTVVTCNFGRHGMTSFFSVSQPTNTPWLFTSTVALKQIFDNSNLPPAVQAQLNNLDPDAFSVQQLFFDLDNAALESTPTISGITQGTPAYTALSQVFLGAYFNAMKTNAQPVLNYAIVQNTPDNDPSTLKLTKMEMEVSPYHPPSSSTNALNTLNYLCQTNGNNLPPPVEFPWNWLEQSEESSFDGVISINRNIFVQYFQNQLTNYVPQNCYQPSVYVGAMGDRLFSFLWTMTPGQRPTMTMPPTGAQVLTYAYTNGAYNSATDGSTEPGEDGEQWTGSMSIDTTYNADVQFTENNIFVIQKFVVSFSITNSRGSACWKPINKKIIDIYTLAVDQTGHLTASHNSVPLDQSDPTPTDKWFVDIFTALNTYTNDVAKWAQGYSATGFHSLPVNVPQLFVFPAGKTFTFKDVVFSDNQDLVSHISYVQPNQPT